ncbi:hypothetical protein [Rubrimonas cliftonensis]|uniref:Uncharacterized protein n=1 Tax=Rubrimonas cliftonensis TaxID=89524 RepID=A0A1H4FQ01_9RHOB|nr:hypothetical protein [Rubrimonas cliftonensis]SEA99396.1 hypothetical protein SAMN05444370_12634 [Rubrimonas cliftonensis]
MRRAFGIAAGVVALLWIAAAALFLAGRYGWAGAEPDPLSGVFLIPLGLPWNRLIEAAFEAAWPWLALAAPGINVALLLLLRRWAGGRK